ncbi:MAG TPA: CBS domain-containing protein [Polyangiaceae bacterium]|nr:CBS domain-containing protein [Polyangiaceae bacterium]
MHISNLANRNVHTCSADDTLESAARVMWEADVGCLVVVDNEHHPIAMITDRDVAMAAYTQGSCLRDIPVRHAMSRRLLACRADSAVGEAEALMQREQIRRLPVVSDQGELVGIVALGDLARDAFSSPIRMPLAIPGLAKTLAAVTERRAAETVKAAE